MERLIAMRSPMGRPPLPQLRRSQRLKHLSGRLKRGSNKRKKMARLSDSGSSGGIGDRRRSSGGSDRAASFAAASAASAPRVNNGGGYPTAAVFGGVLALSTILNVPRFFEMKVANHKETAVQKINNTGIVHMDYQLVTVSWKGLGELIWS